MQEFRKQASLKGKPNLFSSVFVGSPLLSRMLDEPLHSFDNSQANSLELFSSFGFLWSTEALIHLIQFAPWSHCSYLFTSWEVGRPQDCFSLILRKTSQSISHDLESFQMETKKFRILLFLLLETNVFLDNLIVFPGSFQSRSTSYNHIFIADEGDSHNNYVLFLF